MYHILLDTDPGIDDALALLLALASPEIQLEAVTTVSGNIDVDQATKNVLALTQLTGHTHIPVARGCDRPLKGTPTYAPHIHGPYGLGYAELPEPDRTTVDQSGPELIIEKVMAAPGALTVVAIGPLTNIASALQKEPRIAEYVREVVIMGGALSVPGNVTPAAEFNIFVDPYAASAVFQAAWPIRLVSLDVTRQVRLQREQIAQIAQSKTPIATCVAQMLEFYLTRSQTVTSLPMHDPLCLASVFLPVITWEPLSIEVECEHPRGKTVVKEKSAGANIRASRAVDAGPFIQMFIDRLSALSTRAAEGVGAQAEREADGQPADSF